MRKKMVSIFIIFMSLCDFVLLTQAEAQSRPPAQEDLCLERLQIQQSQTASAEQVGAQLLRQLKETQKELALLQAKQQKDQSKPEKKDE